MERNATRDRALAAFEAFNAGDEQGLVEMAHPRLEFVALIVRAGFGARTYAGGEGVRGYLRDVRAAWERVSVEVEDVRDAGTAVVARGRVEGQSAGGPLDAPATWILRFRDGLLAHGLVVAKEGAVAAALGVELDATPPLAPPLRLELAAAPESVPRAREGIAEWAANLAASEEERFALELAVTEGVTNAVLHAYPGRPSGPVRVSAEAHHEHVLLMIEDEGQGMRPRVDSSGMGVGLPLIGQLAESLTIATPEGREEGCRLKMAIAVGALNGLPIHDGA